MNSYTSNMQNKIYDPGNFPSAEFPIGMGYVPWQRWGNTYDPSKALQAGTVFPCLDKPFLGRRGNS